MGCCFSSAGAGAADGAAASHAQPLEQQAPSKREAPTKRYSKPKWKSRQPLTPERLQAMQEEYWDTQPHYGGDRVIWDAIRAACEAPDMATTRLLLEAAGVIVAHPDMGVMYDERGARYLLPNYVLCPPTNMVHGGQGGGAAQQQQQEQQVQIQMQPQQQL